MSRKLNRGLLNGLPEEQISAMEHALATIKKNARTLLRSEEVSEEG